MLSSKCRPCIVYLMFENAVRGIAVGSFTITLMVTFPNHFSLHPIWAGWRESIQFRFVTQRHNRIMRDCEKCFSKNDRFDEWCVSIRIQK